MVFAVVAAIVVGVFVVDLIVVVGALVVIFVVADPRNKDESTLCVQLYEADVARPIRLFTISKIE